VHDNSYHRPGCDFFTACCDNNCVTEKGLACCVADKYLPDRCFCCRAAERICDRPTALTPEQLEKGFRMLTKAAVEADARGGKGKAVGEAKVHDELGEGVPEHK